VGWVEVREWGKFCECGVWNEVRGVMCVSWSIDVKLKLEKLGLGDLSCLERKMMLLLVTNLANENKRIG